MADKAKEVLKYKERLLKKLKGEFEEVKVEFQVKKAEKSLESAMLDMEEKIADFDVKIEQAKYDYPINFDALLDMQDQQALVTRRFEQAEKLIKDMF